MHSAEQNSPGSRGENPRFSVVVPFHDAEATLDVCLGSLLAQDRTDYEIVAVDDGSSDGSLEVARRRAAEAGEGRLILHRRSEQGGAQQARMDGVARARGDIVAFIDADCEAPPDWLRRIEERLGSEMVALGGEYRVPPGLPLVARFETRSLQDYWYAHMPEETDHVATGCGAVWRRHLSPEVLGAGLQFRDITSGDDTLMSMALARRGPLRFSPDLYVYHHTRTSLKAYLSQQSRRGQSRSRISLEHFDAKVRRAQDTRMGLIALQILSSALPVVLLPALLLVGRPWLGALSFAPFVLLQLPLLRRSWRAAESVGFLAGVLPLAFLRNLAWGWGGVLGLLRSRTVRESLAREAA